MIAPPTLTKRITRVMWKTIRTVAWAIAVALFWGATWTGAQMESGAAAIIAAIAFITTVGAAEAILTIWTE